MVCREKVETKGKNKMEMYRDHDHDDHRCVRDNGTTLRDDPLLENCFGGPGTASWVALTPVCPLPPFCVDRRWTHEDMTKELMLEVFLTLKEHYDTIDFAKHLSEWFSHLNIKDIVDDLKVAEDVAAVESALSRRGLTVEHLFHEIHMMEDEIDLFCEGIMPEKPPKE